jgi:hypothetical protein
MSDLRVGLVCEGPTDNIVITAAISSLLGGRNFVLNQLQPEASLAFGEMGTGWVGVYNWCLQAVDQGGGSISNNPLFDTNDVLIVHLDADVADETYANGNIVTSATDLPCSMPCPAPSDTTNNLRTVLLRWLGEIVTPPNTTLCTPSKSTEAWVLAALFPLDRIVTSGDLECHDAPANALSVKPAHSRLVRAGKKIRRRYQENAGGIERAWARVRGICTEAERFSTEFLTTIRAAA